MILSELLLKYKIVDDYTIKNEQDFDTLALSRSDINFKVCTFIVDRRYLSDISENVTMVFTTPDIGVDLDIEGVGVCCVDNPRNVFFKLHNALENSKDYKRHIFKTTIGHNCQISKMSSIAENNVFIGDNVVIEEFVVIRENTVIGDNCIIRAGVKIGSVDFEFKYDNEKIFGVNHYGGVVIGDNVEIQCNSIVNRGLYPWDNTVIGDYTKMDAAVFVSHGVKIGNKNMITGHSIIGGRTLIGDGCWIGLNSTIRNGIVIGDNARVNMGSVVSKNVETGQSVTGNFAIDHDRFIDVIKKISK